ncbi:hypothetical protein C1954_04560 [Bacillus stratosphericus]|nr:hypothetical protein C1954_04560 [Bacillus stratosphericus]
MKGMITCTTSIQVACYIEMERQVIKRVINYLLNRSGTSRSRAVISLPVIPFVSEGDQSFTRKVALGKYPIILVIRRLESGDERVAYAMIKFTNEQAIEWELAIKAGQELKILKEDEFFGYGVNTGMAVLWILRQHYIYKLMRISDIKRIMIFIFMRNLQKRSKTTSTHGTALSPVFMTRWTLPCLQQASVTECTQAFGAGCKRGTCLYCEGFSYSGLMRNP